MPGLLEARFCNKCVNKFVIWGARNCQGFLEARFCNKFVNKLVRWIETDLASLITVMFVSNPIIGHMFGTTLR